MKTSHHTIQVLNCLVLGELAAAETCTQAMRLFPQSPAQREWEELREDHLESVDRLRELILREGGHPVAGAPPGKHPLENESAAAGEDAFVEVLMLREECGLHGYAEALSDDKVSPQVKKVLREELMPPVQFHMIALDKLASAI